MCFTFLRINWLLREEKDLRFVVTARRQIEDIALLPSNMKDINIFDKYFYRIIRIVIQLFLSVLSVFAHFLSWWALCLAWSRGRMPGISGLIKWQVNKFVCKLTIH